MRRGMASALVLWGALLSAVTVCRAANYALLVGIDDYQDRNRINSLSAAGADAKGVAAALHEVAGYPAENIRVLTSDGETKPTGNNILFELDQFAARVKAGDNVFVMFSGHGIQLEETSYLLPYDADGRSDSTLKRSAVPTSSITEALSKLPAKALIVAYDMCRSNPRKGARDVTSNNTLGQRQAKDLVIVPANDAAAGDGPRAAVTLFSCSPKERSWEWADKGRGYFSYFLEQGLRHDAADETGTVRVKNLVGYLEKAVYGAVQRDQGQSQTPYIEVRGSGATELVLASGRPASKGGTTAVVATGNSPPDLYAAALQRGFELLQEKRYDAARDRFEEAIKLDPKSSRAAYALGEINASFSLDYDAAEKFFHQAAQLDPTYVKPLQGLAELAYSVKKDPVQGVSYLQQALKIAPDDAALVSDLGYYLLDHVHDYAAAEKQLRRAIDLDPKNADALTNLGLLYLTAKHDLPGGDALLERAYALDPKNVRTMAGVAIIRAALHNDTPGAEKLLRQAMQISPKDPDGPYALGMIYQLGGDTERAERNFRNALELNPKHADSLKALAGLVAGKGDTKQAEQLLRQAIQVDPLDAEPILLLASFASNRGDVKETEKLYRQAMQADPKNATPVLSLAVLTDDVKKDPVEAEALYRKALALDPEDAMAINRLGNLNFWHKHDYVEAERLFRLSMQKGPLLPLPLHNLAMLTQNIKKDYPAAEKLLREAIAMIEKVPGNLQSAEGLGLDVTYRVDLVKCLKLQNRQDDAKAELQQALPLAEALKKMAKTQGITVLGQ